MKKGSRLGLRTIAELLKVSRMTVSMALRNDGRIADRTRKKVHAAAAKLGYTPNPRIGQLMAETARTRHGAPQEVLAYVTSEPTRDGWRKFDGNSFELARQRASEHGFLLEPWWIADPSISSAHLNRILWSRGIKGIVIPNISHQLFIEQGGTLPIEWHRFTVVEIGGALMNPVINQIRHDHYNGMTLTIDKLETLGYRRIGFCVKNEDDLRTHHRWSAAYALWKIMRGHDKQLPPLIIDEVSSDQLCRWVKNERLEVVVSPGLAALHALRKGGLRIPIDIGFASLDAWGPGASKVTGINQNNGEMQTSAVDMLVTLLHRNQRGIPEHPISWVVGGRWIHGQTTQRVRPVKSLLPGIEHERLPIQPAKAP